MRGSALAAPEHQLALLLIGTQARRAHNRARIEELAVCADYGALAAFLRRAPMLALIGRRLLECSDAAPASFVAEVADYSARAQRQGAHQALVTARVTAALNDAGIRVLPLKGPVLSERIYGALDARVSADIDLLLDRADLPQAMQTLERIGYRSPFANDRVRRQPEVHEVLRSAAGLPQIELHWRLHWYGERFSTDLLRHATPGEDGHLRPPPAYELAALLLSYVHEGFAGLRQLADITAWWDRFGDTLTPGGLDKLASSDPAVARPLATSALVAQRLGGLPATRLFAPELLAGGSRAAARLANWPLRGTYPQVGANVTLVDWFLAPRSQRRALFARHLWLSEEVLRLRRRESGSHVSQLPRRQILLMRTLHLIRICGRYAIALPRVCTPAGWAPAPSWLESAAGEGA